MTLLEKVKAILEAADMPSGVPAPEAVYHPYVSGSMALLGVIHEERAPLAVPFSIPDEAPDSFIALCVDLALNEYTAQMMEAAA